MPRGNNHSMANDTITVIKLNNAQPPPVKKVLTPNTQPRIRPRSSSVATSTRTRHVSPHKRLANQILKQYIPDNDDFTVDFSKRKSCISTKHSITQSTAQAKSRQVTEKSFLHQKGGNNNHPTTRETQTTRKNKILNYIIKENTSSQYPKKTLTKKSGAPAKIKTTPTLSTKPKTNGKAIVSKPTSKRTSRKNRGRYKKGKPKSKPSKRNVNKTPNKAMKRPGKIKKKKKYLPINPVNVTDSQYHTIRISNFGPHLPQHKFEQINQTFLQRAGICPMPGKKWSSCIVPYLLFINSDGSLTVSREE